MSGVEPEEHEYLLGTDAGELRRLGFQHQVWIREAADAWERGGFAPGDRLLDVGCGPGYATLDLARLVGAEGRVTGVDVSARFVAELRRRAAALGLENVDARVQDVEALDIDAEAFDGAYARWVLCFLRDPAAVVKRVARALRPGGRLVVHDYSSYAALQLAPGDPAFRGVIDAVVRSWTGQGGDPNVGERLPGMMEDAGLRVVSVTPLARIARPGEALWSWPRTFFDNYLPSLVERGYLSEAARDAFERLWEARGADPTAYFATPPMTVVVGERR
jgi:ubiquinone/menaquinone biosynthesis C-methylase UbiE